MNPLDLLKVLNNFRGRKFLLVIGIGFLVYIGKVEQYWLGCAILFYFLVDVLEKYITHKSEESEEIEEVKEVKEIKEKIELKEDVK
jgi:hypothetical protein